jgi:hypothetical protein
MSSGMTADKAEVLASGIIGEAPEHIDQGAVFPSTCTRNAMIAAAMDVSPETGRTVRHWQRT